jgi:diacylglycerol kinase (ATP)
MQKKNLKLLFIINPVSGGKKKTDWEEQIREYFKESPHAMEFYMLTGNSDATSVEHHVRTINPDRVVAVGGDGTVKLVAEVVKDMNIPVAIIPAGSANGMATEMQVPADVNAALDIAVNGECRGVDAILINDKELCIHLSDIGLNAMLVKLFEKSKNRGMAGYGKAVFRVLWEKRKMYITIRTNKETVIRQAYMVVIANARKYGTGANINPDGKIDDGAFEIIVVRKINLIEIFKAIMTNKSFHPNRIEVFKASSCQLITLKPAYFQVDGEYRGRVKEISAKIHPRKLQFMLPKEVKGER